ncbi:MAG: type VI secretion system baseplate subunit TssF [Pseudomonadota bacterium]
MSTTLQRLYRDELSFLRLQGERFAQQHPQLARFLGESSTDPDIERLLEGFAFLSARLREKIEDDFPELTFSLLNLLWPNYLRPVPAISMMRFDPVEQAIVKHQVVPKDTLLLSRPVEGLPCQFCTAADLSVYPLRIAQLVEQRSREQSVLRIQLQTLSAQPLRSIECDRLSFFFSGTDYTALTLYLWLFRYLDRITIQPDTDDDTYNQAHTRTLQADNLTRIGFSPEEAILPYPQNVFDGYRIIQEFLAFPRRFYGFMLQHLHNQRGSCWPGDSCSSVVITCYFKRALPEDIKVRSEDLSLFCVPAVNLFEHTAEPIVLSGERIQYPLFPADNRQGRYEIFQVERVASTEEKTGEEKERAYPAFESFQHEIERKHHRTRLYYRLAVTTAVEDDRLLHYLAFMRGDEAHYLGRQETISVTLQCTNGTLPEALTVGDIDVPSQKSPSFVTFTNITAPTATCRPVLDSSLHWTLISNLALNYLSLLQPEPLKNILRVYDFAALQDVQIERRAQKRLAGIQSIDTQPVDRLIRGFPVRGLQSTLTLDQEAFSCEGEMYLFATVLSHFFTLYSSINSFHLLRLHNATNNEEYTWELMSGTQPVI